MTELERILDLTRQVEARVDAGDWAEASSLEATRRSLMNDVAKSPAHNPEGLRGLLEELAKRNDRMVAKLTASREGLEKQQSDMARGAPAVRAYLNNISSEGG